MQLQKREGFIISKSESILDDKAFLVDKNVVHQVFIF